MKTILVLLVGVILNSCTVHERGIVKKVFLEEGIYYYTLQSGTTVASERLIYNVGDTIKFVK